MSSCATRTLSQPRDSGSAASYSTCAIRSSMHACTPCSYGTRAYVGGALRASSDVCSVWSRCAISAWRRARELGADVMKQYRNRHRNRHRSTACPAMNPCVNASDGIQAEVDVMRQVEKLVPSAMLPVSIEAPAPRTDLGLAHEAPTPLHAPAQDVRPSHRVPPGFRAPPPQDDDAEDTAPMPWWVPHSAAGADSLLSLIHI